MKILIVDEEATSDSALAKELSASGFEVMTRNADRPDSDLVILNLNGAAASSADDRIDYLRELSNTSPRTLALVLTPHRESETRIRALRAGADACVVSPCAIEELIATIQSLARRSRLSGPGQVRIADLEIDYLRHLATRAGKRLELTRKEFTLLSYFARHEGEVVSRDQISSHAWQIHLSADKNLVEVHIRRLRAKLDDPFEKKLIHTVRGQGYVLKV
jgi:two-component system copper resistance phosphate regulon response regulator CusR